MLGLPCCGQTWKQRNSRARQGGTFGRCHCDRVRVRLEVVERKCHYDIHQGLKEAEWKLEALHFYDDPDVERTALECDQHSCEEEIVVWAAFAHVLVEIWVVKEAIVVDVHHMVEIVGTQVIEDGIQPS